MWPELDGDRERCDECRFDAAEYTAQDLAGTLRNLAGWLGASVAGIDPALLRRRPGAAVWSPAEYLRHTKRVLWSMAELATVALTASIHDAPTIEGEAPPDARADDTVPDIDPLRELIRVNEEAMRLHELWTGSSAEQRSRAVVLNGHRTDLTGIVAHAVHDATHHASDIGRGIAALGAGTPVGDGTVVSLQASSGVPKRPVDVAVIGYRGIEGDRQETRRHHGRVWQALCLWSADVIDALADEGHPVFPGAAGENLTLGGIDWSTLRPGARMMIGGRGGLVIEATTWAEPCRTIAHCFAGRDFRRIDAVRHPGTSRIYAKVLRDGTVRPGDAVRVY